MPGYKGHLCGGAFFYFVILLIILQFNVYISDFIVFKWLGFVLLGSLFPDIDTKSKGQKWFYTVFVVIFIILLLLQKYTGLIFFSFLVCFPLLVNHRGILHNIWFIIFIMIITLYLLKYMYMFHNNIIYNVLFFFLGIVSHLWLDLGFFKMIGYKKKRR